MFYKLSNEFLNFLYEFFKSTNIIYIEVLSESFFIHAKYNLL